MKIYLNAACVLTMLSQNIIGKSLFNSSSSLQKRNLQDGNKSDNSTDSTRNENLESDDPQQIVNRVVFIISGLLVIMLLGLIVYFFKMRVGTMKVSRKNVKREPKMLSIVTIDGKSSPDKIIPY